MKFRIHFDWPDGTEDSVVVSGDTVEEVRAKADEAIGPYRDGVWSEELPD